MLLASDEAYSELWFEGPPPVSALQVGDLTNVLAINTLSKRSSMTGYRSAFAAGDPGLIGALKALRPSVGVTPQEFVQRASIAAWNDETHVEDNRARYAEKRQVFIELFARHGVRIAGSVATFYLWIAVPGGRPSLDWALDLIDRAGVIVAPGSFFGTEGGVRSYGDGADVDRVRARGRAPRRGVERGARVISVRNCASASSRAGSPLQRSGGRPRPRGRRGDDRHAGSG